MSTSELQRTYTRDPDQVITPSFLTSTVVGTKGRRYADDDHRRPRVRYLFATSGAEAMDSFSFPTSRTSVKKRTKSGKKFVRRKKQVHKTSPSIPQPILWHMASPGSFQSSARSTSTILSWPPLLLSALPSLPTPPFFPSLIPTSTPLVLACLHDESLLPCPSYMTSDEHLRSPPNALLSLPVPSALPAASLQTDSVLPSPIAKEIPPTSTDSTSQTSQQDLDPLPA